MTVAVFVTDHQFLTFHLPLIVDCVEFAVGREIIDPFTEFFRLLGKVLEKFSVDCRFCAADLQLG